MSDLLENTGVRRTLAEFRDHSCMRSNRIGQTADGGIPHVWTVCLSILLVTTMLIRCVPADDTAAGLQEKPVPQPTPEPLPDSGGANPPQQPDLDRIDDDASDETPVGGQGVQQWRFFPPETPSFLTREFFDPDEIPWLPGVHADIVSSPLKACPDDSAEHWTDESLRTIDSGDDTTWPQIRGNSGIQRVSFQSTVTFLSAQKTTRGNDANSPPEVSPQPLAGGAASSKPSGNVTVIPAAAAPVVSGQNPAGQDPPVQNPPAQTPSTEPPAVNPANATLTLEVVAARRAAAEQTPDLTDEVKSQLMKYFQRASESLTQKADADKKAAELKAEKENGPALIAEYKALQTQPPPKSEPEYPPGATVAELDQLRLMDEEKLAETRRNLETWNTKAKIRAERKPQMLTLIEATRKQLEDAENALESPAPEGELPVLGIARRTDQETFVLLLRSQLELYRIEQSRYEALNPLFPLQLDVLTRANKSAEKRVELWKTVLAEARREESARQAREAREKLRNAHPTLRDLAEKNSKLTTRRKELQDLLSAKNDVYSEVDTELKNLRSQYDDVTDKEKRAGLTTAMGLLLRGQRAQLPDAGIYRTMQKDAESEIVQLLTEQMPLQDERRDLSDIDAQVEKTLSEIPSGNVPENELREMTLELLSDRRQYLDDLLADYAACLKTLEETDVGCRSLEGLIREVEGYIDERILWIASAPAFEYGFFHRTLNAARSFAFHREWLPLWKFLIDDVQAWWPLYAMFLAGFGAILGLTRRIRRFVMQLGEQAEKQLDAGIPLTLLATGLTIVMASAWPALLWFAGWRISRSELNLASALKEALTVCSLAVWIVDSFRTLCRKNGVTVSFLEWPRTIVRSLHSSLLLYLAVGVPLIFIDLAAAKLDDGSSAESVGRLAFVIFCVLLAIILRRLVRPNGQVIGDLLRSNPKSLMYRLRWVWYPVAVGAPLSLAVLSLMGYQYTAEQLMIRLQLTLGLSFIFIIAYTMVMQWMLAARRSLALKQARARRAAAVAAAKRESEENGGVAASPVAPIETPQVDLSLLNQQMLRLIQGSACILFLTISWAIWGQVLPALQVFSRIELWQVVVESTQPIATATQEAGLREITRVEPVTLGHLLFSLVVFSAAIIASRNLPGLLELAVLQRLPMDHGGRNAITTLCRYAFLLTGSIVACNFLGINWGSVQWLVAALTVGLGFGLQEIFANFVSGLIILFERPVRIGDLVTIDAVSGCVSKIQMRATTITDWDRKEYIVPNKEFVTGKVLNWTLSDKTNRIVIEVGVAYGTDTEQALALLSEIADEHPLILKDPAPLITFEGFGESCLNLKLRCYLPNFDHRMKVITQLHVMINRRFSEAGIEIAFPQRDLHIRSLPPNFGVATTAQQPAETATPMPDESSQVKKRSA